MCIIKRGNYLFENEVAIIFTQYPPGVTGLLKRLQENFKKNYFLFLTP